MPSKALQYLRAGRPILALVESGGVIRDVVGRMPQAHLMDRGDFAGVAALIDSMASMPRSGSEAPRGLVLTYSRREIARRFAAVLEEAADRRARAGRPAREMVGA
jgi:hypothetical protein